METTIMGYHIVTSLRVLWYHLLFMFLFMRQTFQQGVGGQQLHADEVISAEP